MLRETVGDDRGPVEFQEAWDGRTQELVTPYIHDQMAADRVRVAEMTASTCSTEKTGPVHPAKLRRIWGNPGVANRNRRCHQMGYRA